MLIIKANGQSYSEACTKWEDFPEPITSMEFQVTDNKTIVFEGFEKYIRVKEMYKGVNCSVEGMSKILLLGECDSQVAVVEINCKTGEVKQTIKRKGVEYNNKPLNKTFWKKGIKGVPKVFIR